MNEKDRFNFGDNWADFLSNIDEKTISLATESLVQNLQVSSLAGKSVLDIGSGSGLFSLAAHKLGAKVVSIDYDEASVACTRKIKEEFADNNANWEIMQGSVLDDAFMESLGEFDGVYSWGVLHHTGDMDNAIRLTSERVKPNGWMFIAIYNDQGTSSRIWLKIKQLYNRLPKVLRPPFVFLIAAYNETRFALKRMLTLQSPLPPAYDEQHRGMSVWYDWVDWVGGLPFQVATPEQIIQPLRAKGFILDKLITIGHGWGCNEFVFHLDKSKIR